MPSDGLDLNDFLSTVATGYGAYVNADASKDVAKLNAQTAAANAAVTAQQNQTNANLKMWALYALGGIAVLLVVVFIFKKLR